MSRPGHRGTLPALVAVVMLLLAGCAGGNPAPGGMGLQPQDASSARQEDTVFQSTMTCTESNALLKTDPTASGIAIIWLDGVYSGRAGLTAFPKGWAVTLAQGIGGLCAVTVGGSRSLLDVIAELHQQYGGTTPAVFDTAITCSDFLALLKTDPLAGGGAMLWLDGFYSGRTGLTTFPGRWLTSLSRGVGSRCGIPANGSRSFLDVISELRRQPQGAVRAT